MQLKKKLKIFVKSDDLKRKFLHGSLTREMISDWLSNQNNIVNFKESELSCLKEYLFEYFLSYKEIFKKISTQSHPRYAISEAFQKWDQIWGDRKIPSNFKPEFFPLYEKFKQIITPRDFL